MRVRIFVRFRVRVSVRVRVRVRIKVRFRARVRVRVRVRVKGGDSIPHTHASQAGLSGMPFNEGGTDTKTGRDRAIRVAKGAPIPRAIKQSISDRLHHPCRM